MLDAWIAMEKAQGNVQEMNELLAKKPKKVRRRHVEKIGDGEGEEMEHEYIDYVFPDDSTKDQNSKILQMAYMWKKRKADMDAAKAAKEREEAADA